jgi:aminoglycoside 6-adenylyltransferase
MRSFTEIKQMLTGLAQYDNRIRAVLLQGSRANKNISPDPLQDYDIVFVVNQMESFITDHRWTNVFGEKLIWQLPNTMEIGHDESRKSVGFHYLMLFKDGVRIDLSLFPVEKMSSHFTTDSLTIVWLDKDGLFSNIELPSDKDYLTRRPTEKEFRETCNEFWWVSLNVSKGLLRREITYAKAMMEGPVRQMFMRMIEWHIGIETKFSVSSGKAGKFMDKYLRAEEYAQVLATYPDFQIENIWKSLFIMTSLFSTYAKQVADNLQFRLNIEEQENTKDYLLRQYAKEQ